jgi:hypothetical protein
LFNGIGRTHCNELQIRTAVKARSLIFPAAELALGVDLRECTRRQEQANDPKQCMSSHGIKSEHQFRISIPKSLAGRYNAAVSFDGTLLSYEFAKKHTANLPGSSLTINRH